MGRRRLDEWSPVFSTINLQILSESDLVRTDDFQINSRWATTQEMMERPSTSSWRWSGRTPTKSISGWRWRPRWENWRNPTRSGSAFPSHPSGSYSTAGESTTMKPQSSWKWSLMMSLRCIRSKLVDDESIRHYMSFHPLWSSVHLIQWQISHLTLTRHWKKNIVVFCFRFGTDQGLVWYVPFLWSTYIAAAVHTST